MIALHHLADLPVEQVPYSPASDEDIQGTMSRGRAALSTLLVVDHKDELLAGDAARCACERLPARRPFLMPTN